MSAQDLAIAKIRSLPDALAEEVSDFIDSLLLKKEPQQEPAAESMELAESGMEDYLGNLEDYEEQLARGEIQW